MAILTNLFGESPFGALESHGEKVHECVRLLKDVFKHLTDNNTDQLKQTAQQISALETEADKIRNHLHEMLTGKVMMPMSKEELFNVLEQQDSMADRAEDISATLTYRDMRLPADLMAQINEYLAMVLKNCELAEREDAVKPRQHELTQKLLAIEDQISPIEAILWIHIIGHLAELSKAADRTGNGIRMTLQIKSLK